ncbi:MAG: hypothetical protein ABSD74_08440 [Rhizomicrobium sp.]
MTVLSKSAVCASVLALSAMACIAAHAAVTISSAATSNMSCTSGVCTPTAANAVLNVGDLTTILASGNVTVNTGTGSLASEVEDIVVDASFNWASASSLTLDAYRSVTVEQPVAVNGSAPVTLTTNDGGSGGALSFGTSGSLSFLGTSNSLTIDGTAYTLENSVASLASAIAANSSGTYALASNYNASVDGVYGTSPIATSLAGTVQGLGNTISNLSIVQGKAKTGIGLFTTVASSGVIENFRLTNIAYKNANHKSSGGVGGLVLDNSGYLFNDEASGSIKATGYSDGPRGSAGGLVDLNEQAGSIVSSSASVRIAAQSAGGGLVAENSGSITLSHGDGSIEAAIAGGLVGQNAGTIGQSYATGAVTGESGGGLVGTQIAPGTASNSYATGSVAAGTKEGGIVGDDSASNAPIGTSYSIGAVAAGYDGGFACLTISANISDAYWDTTTSGTTYSDCDDLNVSGITGLTSAQLKSGLPAGFDPTIWAESSEINSGFPYLVANPPPATKKKK